MVGELLFAFAEGATEQAAQSDSADRNPHGAIRVDRVTGSPIGEDASGLFGHHLEIR